MNNSNENRLSDGGSLAAAAEKMADHIRNAPLTDAVLRHLEAASGEFLRSRGFDISTPAGCRGALLYLRSCRVEDAFLEDESAPVDNAADWYLGEARLDGMIRIVEERIRILSAKESEASLL